LEKVLFIHYSSTLYHSHTVFINSVVSRIERWSTPPDMLRTCELHLSNDTTCLLFGK